MLRICALFVLAFASSAYAAEGRFSGVVRVIDGDTFDVGTTRVRLHGIDAVESNQTCYTEQGVEWACGKWVNQTVRASVQGETATCKALGTDRYGRVLATCTVAGSDLGATLVSEGLAMAYRNYSSDYTALEESAAAKERGLWSMDVQSPQAFRLTQAASRSAKTASAPSNGKCVIKGNISSKGDRIYHVPGQDYYEKTKISRSKGERWFCSEDEARKAGWRKSRT